MKKKTTLKLVFTGEEVVKLCKLFYIAGSEANNGIGGPYKNLEKQHLYTDVKSNENHRGY